MGFFAEYFGERKFLNLADERMENNRSISRPKTTDNKSQLDRATKDTIRNLYNGDWFTFSTVNISASLFSKPKTKIVSSDQNGWQKFFDTMRDYGTNTSLKRLRKELKKDTLSYGASYIEYVYDITGEVILDLKRVEASKIEHAKNKTGNFLLDEKGSSIGYVLHLGFNSDLRSKGDPVPTIYQEVIDIQNGDIFLDSERIAEFPLHKLGNDTEAIGIVEPAITQTNRRMNLETAQVNALWIRDSAPIFMEVGDERHEPNPQMMEDAIDMVSNLRSSHAVAIPFYNKFGTVDAKVDGAAMNIMNYLMAGQAGAGSVPLPFVTGAGEATNRSTLKTQRELFELSMQDYVDCFDEDWNNQVMKKIEKVNGLPEGKLISEDIRLESNDETAKRLKIYVEIGNILGTPVLSPEEVRQEIIRIEGINEDESYEKFVKEKEKERKEFASNQGGVLVEGHSRGQRVDAKVNSSKDDEIQDKKDEGADDDKQTTNK
ncbi:MAG: hypothetical protein ACTSU6_05335 [Candidatus Njordarchaeales archaeon]